MIRGVVDDLHELAKVRDRLSYVYAEHCRVDREDQAIALWSDDGLTPVPAASLSVLMLGPGTVITHAAVKVLADNACLVVWCGEENIRYYAFGTGGTHSTARLMRQARCVVDPERRLEVCRRMYAMRFEELPRADFTIEQLRGMEGARVRRIYAEWSERTGVPWHGRQYDRGNWSAADLPNRALSAANACLYGLCHAAVVAAGYHPGLGFIHTGTERAFVLDIADLYKHEISVPIAFQVAAAAPPQPERAARLACRDRFRETKLLQRIVPDIERVLGPLTPEEAADEAATDADPTAPHALWEPEERGTAEV